MSLKKKPFFAAAAFSLLAVFGLAAGAPRHVSKTADLPFGNSLNRASFEAPISYAAGDDVLLMVRPYNHSLQETTWLFGDLFSFKAARPADKALLKDMVTPGETFGYYTEGNAVSDRYTTYAPGTLDSTKQWKHDLLMKVYATVVAARPGSIPANADITCEKPVGETKLVCHQF